MMIKLLLGLFLGLFALTAFAEQVQQCPGVNQLGPNLPPIWSPSRSTKYDPGQTYTFQGVAAMGIKDPDTYFMIFCTYSDTAGNKYLINTNQSNVYSISGSQWTEEGCLKGTLSCCGMQGSQPIDKCTWTIYLPDKQK